MLRIRLRDLLRKDIQIIQTKKTKPTENTNQKIYDISPINPFSILKRDNRYILVTFKEIPFFTNIDKLLKEFNIDYHEIIKGYFKVAATPTNSDFRELIIYEETDYSQTMMSNITATFEEKIKEKIKTWFKNKLN
jgi:DNA-binding ferritin-like protein (Dps family)